MNKLNQNKLVTMAVLVIATVTVGWFAYTALGGADDKTSGNGNNADIVGNNGRQSSNTEEFSCLDNINFSVPKDWEAVSAKNSEDGIIAGWDCAISNESIDELPGDLRALEPSDILISVNVNDINQNLSSYVDSQFPTEGESLGVYSEAKVSEFSFDNGETGIKVSWELDISTGTTYFYAYTPGNKQGSSVDSKVVSMEVMPGNSEYTNQADAVVGSFAIQ